MHWRRQGSRSASRPSTREGDSSSSPQSAATLPAHLAGSTIGSFSLGSSEHQRGGAAAGSLRHSYSCPQPTHDSSKGANQLQHSISAARPPRHPSSSMVRASADAGQQDCASSSSSHELDDLEDDEQLGQHQQQHAAWGPLPQGYHNGSRAGGGAQHGTPQRSNGSSSALVAAGNGHGHHLQHSASPQHGGQQQQLEVEARKFTRNLLSANNKKESLERYKAIMALIEACKRRLEAQLGSAGAAAVLASAAWTSEPLLLLLQSVLDVGEALASFGNCHFPEHSNEARAILAGDYRALLRQYLSTFGSVFAEPSKQQLPHDMQEEVQCVGSLLATRCEAYDLLYDQLVRHVGLEGRGGPQTFILNHNSAASHPATNVTANPVNTNSASAVSNSRAKAAVSGLGAAAIAAAGLAAVLLFKGLSRGRGGRSSSSGGRRSSSSSSSSSAQGQNAHQAARPLRVPKGRNGRELLLVSQLSGCADELRRAAANEEALKDDWRLGRHVRLAWPPGPPLPPGYAPLSPDACNVSSLLSELYG